MRVTLIFFNIALCKKKSAFTGVREGKVPSKKAEQLSAVFMSLNAFMCYGS
jgi:hypothetical protein